MTRKHRKAYMPLFIGDFLADTMHLSATETGIYIRLLWHCWQHGSIPRDRRKLALISHLDPRLWHQYEATVLQFFDIVDASTMHNKRVSTELHRYEEISNKRKAAALQKHSKCDANAVQMHPHPDPDPIKKERKQDPDAGVGDAPLFDNVEVINEDPQARLFRVGKTILVSFGVAEKRTGALLGMWLKSRNDPVGLLAAIQFARDQNVVDPVAYVSAMIKEGKANGQKSAGDRAHELAEEWRRRERDAQVSGSADNARSARPGRQAD
jgi:uncharacterized protein YdaU (DUF1376 family)